MVRKIRSKKFGRKKFKDPQKQLQAKFEKTKHKFDHPPLDPNEQEIPKKFQFIVKPTQQKSENIEKKDESELLDTAKFVSQKAELSKDSRPFKPIPTVKQMEGESDSKFMRRVNGATAMVVSESKFQDRYQVEVQRNEFGEVVNVTPRVTEKSKKIKERQQLKRQERKEKWKMKKKLKEFRTMNRNTDEFYTESDYEDDYINQCSKNVDSDDDEIDEREKVLFQKETIAFGETVHQPPKLETDKLQKRVSDDRKMKIKNYIFLQNTQGTSSKSSKNNVNKSKARQKIIEIEREKAMFAYKQVKARRLKSAGLTL